MAFDPDLLPADSLATFEPGKQSMDGSRDAGPEETGSAQTLPPPPPGAAPRPSAAAKAPPYRLLRIVGRGGAGDVWEAEQVGLRRRVALKRVRDAAVDDEARRAAAIRECRQEALAAAALDHPNIVPVHELVEDPDGGLAFSMKLVRGVPWEQLLVDDRALMHPEDYRAKHLRILLDVAQAVAFAHSRGIVHRDIKPTQVMAGEFGETLLMDWGLALRMAGADTGEEPLAPEIPTTVEARNPAGTPACMAPEQTRETAEGIGPWTDVFLLGACLYRILEGRYLYAEKSARECFRRAVDCRYDPPRADSAPEDLLALLRDSLAAHPSQRIADARAFRERLEEHLSGAGRRRESDALAAEAERVLDEARPATYAACESALALAARAREAWSRNPQAARVRAKAAEQYARLALAGGDLQLAEAQAAGLAPGRGRDGLLAAIRRAQRARRAVRLAAASLAVLVLAGALYHTQRVAAARDLAEAARVEAEAARVEAEEQRDSAERSLRIAGAQSEGAYGLVDFVLGALHSALNEELTFERGIEPAEANLVAEAVARRVAEPIVDYYEALDAAGWPEPLLVAHTDRIAETAWRFIEFGRVEEAQRLVLRARADRDAAFGPGHPSTATLVLAEAAAEQRRGNHRRAVELADQAMALIDFSRLPDRSSLAFLHAVRGSIFRTAGMPEEARRELELGLAAVEGDPDTEPRALATALLALGVQYGAENRHEEALPLLRRSLELYSEPRQRARALGAIGFALVRLGRLDEAAPVLEEAIQLASRYEGPNSGDTLEYRGHRVEMLQKRGDLDAAQAEAESILAALRRTRPEGHESIGMMALLLGSIHFAREEFAEALPLLRESLAIEGSYDTPESRQQNLVGAFRIAAHLWRAAAAEGDGNAARERAREAIDIFEEHRAGLERIAPVRFDVALMLEVLGEQERSAAMLERLRDEGFAGRIPPQPRAEFEAALERMGLLTDP